MSGDMTLEEFEEFRKLELNKRCFDHSSFNFGSIPDEPLAENEWPILLQFDGGRFEGKVLLDSACLHNWISDRIVTQYKMPWDQDPHVDNVYREFSNNEVRSSRIARVGWINQKRLVEVDFKIAKNPPFDVLFGCSTLLRYELIKIYKSSPIEPLVKDKRNHSATDKKAMEVEEQQALEQRNKIQHYLAWRSKMEEDGWKWSKSVNKYYKISQDHQTVWDEEGYSLNRFVDRPLSPGR